MAYLRRVVPVLTSDSAADTAGAKLGVLLGAVGRIDSQNCRDVR